MKGFSQAFFGLACFGLGLLGITSSLQAAITIEQDRPHDIHLQSAHNYANPYMDVSVEATFSGPHGLTLKVPGFYDGAQSWTVRFSAPTQGFWSYTTTCSDTTNGGLHQRTGSFTALPNTNPKVRGPLLVDPAAPHHFVRPDGSHFLFLGYEADWLWALDAGQGSLPKLTHLVDQVEEHGFTVLTLNLYAYDTLWSPGHQNQWDYGPPPLHLWEGTNDNPDHSRLNDAFFDHFDRMMDLIYERGLYAHIMFKVYNKEVFWPPMESPEDDLFHHYIVARYQAYPNVIWDPAKESYNTERGGAPGYVESRIEVIEAADAYNRLITVHDPDNAQVDDLGDFKSDQVHYNHYDDAYQNFLQFARPYVNVEYGYERGVDDLPTYGVSQDWDDVLRRTWIIAMGGGYTNYYYSNTAWDLIKANPEPPGYDRYRYFADFWQQTEFWRLDPDPVPVRGGDWTLCRAREGEEYVFFIAGGSQLTFRVSQAPQPLFAEWLNIETGEVQVDASTYPNGDHQVVAPWPNTSILYLIGSVDPIALFTVSNREPLVGESVRFDATASYARRGQIDRYEWDFDGDSIVDAEGPIVEHAYQEADIYNPMLRVIDDGGRVGTRDDTIAVSSPGFGLKAEYFNREDLSDLVFVRKDPQVDFGWGSGPPDDRIENDGTFSERWTGWVMAPTAGTYEFFTLSNDGVRLWIDDQLLIDNWTQHSEQEDRTGPLYLTKGWHAVKLTHFQNGGVATIRLSIEGPGLDKQTIPPHLLRSTLAPRIEWAGASPNPYLGGPQLYFDVLVNDPDGLDDIARVELQIFDPGGTFRGLVFLPRDPVDPKHYFLHIDNLTQRIPPGLWLLGVVVHDMAGDVDVAAIVLDSR